MKKILLTLFTVFATMFAGYAQTVNVSPVLCADTANNIYIVDSTVGDVSISIEDPTGTTLATDWTPTNHLFFAANNKFPYQSLPGGWASPIYFNTNDYPDTDDADGDGDTTEIIQGPEANQTYTYTATYDPGTGPQSTTITIVNGGFTYDQFCFGSTKTLADIDILGIPATDLTWYDDAAQTNVLPNTDPIVGDTTYYVNLGPSFSGCTNVFRVVIEYKTPIPEGIIAPKFCSAATWQGLGVGGMSDPTLADLNFCTLSGSTLTFYDASGNVIPSGTLLQDATTYYVTQTYAGCESAQMAIVPDEQFCACSQNAGMEDYLNLGNSYNVFYMDDPQAINPTVCNVNISTINQSIGFGTLDSTGDDPAVPVSNGYDPAMLVEGTNPVYFPTTSPLKGCSKYAIRLNSFNDATYGSGGTDKAVKLTYDFIAGEVFTFDFAAILRAANHENYDQPYFKALIVQNGTVIQERCIIANEDGCTFYNLPGAWEPILYSTWSCVKFSTQEILGQPATAVFIVSDCAQAGDFGYAYVDNIYVGSNAGADCDGTFGYVFLEPDIADGDAYETCSEIVVPTNPQCSPATEALNPVFPITVTANYKEPESTGNNVFYKTAKLFVYQNGQPTPVLVKSNPTAPNATQFQFTIQQNEIVNPYGYFSFEVELQYDLTCGQNGSSSSTSVFRDDGKGFKFCPTAGCASSFDECAGSGGSQVFDLTSKESEILAGIPAAQQANYKITYYSLLADAEAGTGAITSPATYSTATSATIFARLEFDFASAGITPPQKDCFDIVPISINVGTRPTVPATTNAVDGCGLGNSGTFDLTQNDAAILGSIPPTSVILSYHITLSDAQLGINPIGTPTAYPGTTPQDIFVRVEKVSDGCYAISEFPLNVIQVGYNPLTTLSVCDQDANTVDGSTSVDLGLATAQITAGFPGLTLTYYPTLNDAQNGTSALPVPGFITTDTTVWVVIQDGACSLIDSFDVDVVDSPEAFPGTVELCDADNDGSGTFTLTPALENTVSGGSTAGITVTFHATSGDADTNTNPITTHTSGSTTIYARVDNGTCFNTSVVTLTLKPSPDLPATVPALELCDDNNPGDGIETFNLTDAEPDLTANEPTPGDYTVTYYASLSDLTAGTPIPTTDLTAYPNTTAGQQTIHVIVTSGNACTSQGQFDIIVNPLPSFTAITTFETCDNLSDTQDGLAEFNLSNAAAQLNAGTGATVTFYDDQAKADAGTAGTEISTTTPYQNISVGETIYARIEDNTTGCYDTTNFTLNAIPAPTVPAAPPVYEVCDGDDGNIDAQAVFNLSTLDGTISGGASGVTVSYHIDQAAADAGTPALNPNYTSISRTIVARVTENSGNGCYNTVDVTLTVLDSPLPPASINPLEECDPEGDGIETFNLTDAEVDIRANEGSSASAPWTITYYASAADRTAGTTVMDETDFTNDVSTPTQPIFFRITGANGCTTDGQFDVVVNALPGVNTPAPRIICGDGSGAGIATFDLTKATTQITGNNPSFTVEYYETEAAAQAGDTTSPEYIGTPGSYQNGTPYNDSVWIRIVDNVTSCEVVLEVPLEVKEAPVANEPLPYEVCDPDNDGFGLFNLPSLDAEITGGVTGVTVTYHETLPNAQNDVLDITSPGAFANTVNGGQTIFARVESAGVDCYVVVNVVLVVNPSPQPVLPQDLPDLIGCDEDGDGMYQFDLTEMEDDILFNESDPTLFILEYYADPADIPASPIGTPTGHVSGSGTIHVVVTGPNDCTKPTSFEVVVNPLPEITTPQPLELCDVNNPGDEKEEFDLTQATMEITMGDPGIDISYYNLEADALAGTNAITNPTAYTNQVNNETIYIRAVDADTGCVTVEGYTLTLIVNPLPSPEIPADPLEVCDADNDGFVEFDLDDIVPVIQNNEPDVAISFHYSLQDADNGVGAIDTTQPFQLTSANSQILYVRAENTITGCYVTGELELEVVPVPEITSLDDLYVCDDGDANGFAVFDLTENTPNVLGTQDPTDLVVTYHTDPQDAEDGTGAIAVPSAYTNTSNPQTIYVRVENTATECYDTFDNSFELYVEELPVVNDPSPLALCDDDYASNPEQVVFDLTVKEGEITGQAFPPSDYEFTYYANQQDFNNDVPISNPMAYENITNPQTIYITVMNEDTNNLCEDYTTLTITVQSLPSPSETDQDVLRLEECDDDNDGVAAEPFDLTISGTLIAGNENVELNYYKTQAAAQTGDTNSPEHIATPDAYTNEPAYNTVNGQGMEVQVIYVHIESNAAGNDCYVTAQFEIMVVPAPVLNDITPFGYTLCEDGNTGTGTVFQQDIAYNLYDALAGDPSVLVPLLDQAENADLNLDNYDIHYYESINPDVPLSSGYVASTGDIIYVRVEYGDTGCFSDAGEIEITVEPRPAITVINITEFLCSDGPGGNTATIDLTQYDGQINPGAPANTEVVYYADMNAYMNGSPIADPSVYVTETNPQTIIAVVRDTINLCESADYAQITIEVEPGPLVDISGYSGVICEDIDPATQVTGGDYMTTTIETGLDETLYTFEWTLDGSTLPETGNSLVVTQAGTYEVIVTDNATGCESTSTATFTSGNPPEFDVDPLTMAFDEEHALQISNVTGLGDYEFSVDNGPWTDLGADGTLTFEGLSAGTHFVYGRDKDGCGTTVKVINFIDFPKFFTPNNDGYNDTWNVLGLGEENASAKIYIFDRYGKLLKQLSPSGPGWDGTYNGEPVPADDYWFRVEYYQTLPDGTYVPREFKANFSLIR